VRRFTRLLANAARPCRHAVGDRWQVDETYVKVAASGATSTVRSTSSATRQPRFVTDRAPVYAGVLEELLPSVWHRTDRYANNRLFSPIRGCLDGLM
jgi:transposase-like protein